MLSASIVLPLSYLLGALALGPSLGFLSVAAAWAVGYPLAFGVLIWLALQTLDWKAWAFVRSVAGVAACMLGAMLIGMAVRYVLLGHVPSWAVLAIVAVVIVGATGLLLAYTQGLSLRTAKRALQGDPTADLSSPSLHLDAAIHEADAAAPEAPASAPTSRAE
jgi:hypothetical protein